MKKVKLFKEKSLFREADIWTLQYSINQYHTHVITDETEEGCMDKFREYLIEMGAIPWPSK